MPNSYIEFETIVQDKLMTPFNRTDDYAAFLKANLNSVRIAQLKSDMEK